MQSSWEIVEFEANGPTTCHSSLSDNLLAFECVSTSCLEFDRICMNLFCFLFVVFGAAMRRAQ